MKITYSVPPKSDEHRAVLNKLIQAYTAAANEICEAENAGTIIIVDAGLNFVAQMMCQIAIRSGAPKASAVSYAKHAAELLPELVENNFERFKAYIDAMDPPKQ